MILELQALGIRSDQQKTVPILYRGVKVGEHRLDLLVEDCRRTLTATVPGTPNEAQ